MSRRQPSRQTQSSATSTVTALRLVRLLRPYRRLTVVATLGLGSIALNVSGPLLLGHATNLIFAGVVGRRFPAGSTREEVIARLREEGDSALVPLIRSVEFVPGQGVDSSAVGLTLLAALAAYIVSGVLWAAQGRVTTTLVQRTVYRLRREAQDKLARLPLSYFDQERRGEVLSRTTNDIDNTAQSLQQTLSQITNSALLLASVLGIMLWISPLLSVVALVAVPLSMYLTRVIGKRAQRQFASVRTTMGALNAHVDEAYTGHSVITAFGRQRESAQTFQECNEQLYQSSARAQFASGTIGPVTTLIGNLSYVIVAVVGGLQMAAGVLSIGAVQAFIQYSRQFTQPLTAMAHLSDLVQSGVASAGRVFEFLDAKEESAPNPTVSASTTLGRGRVSLESISFRYAPDKPLIDDLSLTVEPGQTIAIVGPTGAGKTTLVDLLVRFYDVLGGRVILDGTDIRDLERDTLRARIGMVPQDPWLFHGTIRDNIAYGRREASEDEIVAAAQAAQVDHLIRTLPDGYDTLVGNEGTILSSGERQLITIARAIVADPIILVLDEATSSVDTRTELLIQRAISHVSLGRTTFIIAHRLTTIREADLILVVEHGAIVEQGTHDELLAADGAYGRLYSAQRAGPGPV